MTIRKRLTLWYAVIMFVSLLTMGGLMYRAFAPDPQDAIAEHTVESDESDWSEILRILFWCGVPPAVIALAGGWWLMRRALTPVVTLTAVVEKIHENNLDEKIPCSGNGDELDRLTEVFNAMTARLNDSFNRIHEFTLHASHELKTPLTILRGETEMALRDSALAPAERERAVSQLQELQRLTRIVDGLTLLAKADAGQILLTPETVSLAELVRDSFADLQILAEPTGLQVELATCEEISVRGDRHRLRQLLLNLADNAVKYSQPHGQVTLALRRVEGLAEFTITNTGEGIPPEILPRVFDRFYRGDPAHSATVDGCGLGLSIARWIVSAHAGSITIASEPAKFTTVTVRLPLAASR
jgi:signal transduction histidine kinase